MNKTFFVTALVLTVLAIGFALNSQTTTPANLVPFIVAKFNLTNQTQPIPATTISRPKESGLYRLSATMLMTSPATYANLWQMDLHWTDDVGAEDQEGFITIINTAAPPNDYPMIGPSMAGNPFIFRAAFMSVIRIYQH